MSVNFAGLAGGERLGARIGGATAVSTTTAPGASCFHGQLAASLTPMPTSKIITLYRPIDSPDSGDFKMADQWVKL